MRTSFTFSFGLVGLWAVAQLPLRGAQAAPLLDADASTADSVSSVPQSQQAQHPTTPFCKRGLLNCIFGDTTMKAVPYNPADHLPRQLEQAHNGQVDADTLPNAIALKIAPVVKALLERPEVSGNINRPGPVGRTPMQEAAIYGDPEIVQMLKNQGASLEAPSKAILTASLAHVPPAQLASIYGHPDVAEMLKVPK
jgi:hypothetical protein